MIVVKILELSFYTEIPTCKKDTIWLDSEFNFNPCENRF